MNPEDRPVTKRAGVDTVLKFRFETLRAGYGLMGYVLTLAFFVPACAFLGFSEVHLDSYYLQ